MAKGVGSHRQVGRMDRAIAKSLYDQGFCDADIAEACKVKPPAVAYWRNQVGLPPNKTVKKKPAKSPIAQRAWEARTAGKTYGQYMATLRGGR